MHDLVAVGLHLEATTNLSRPQHVRERIEDAVRNIDDSVTHLRVAIFDLDPGGDAAGPMGLSGSPFLAPAPVVVEPVVVEPVVVEPVKG